MPRYVTKGGMIKCHAYQFLDNVDYCEVNHLAKTNPDAVKIVGSKLEPPTITVHIDDSGDTLKSSAYRRIVAPRLYYLVFYTNGEVSAMSSDMFSAHHERDNPSFNVRYGVKRCKE